MRIKTFRRHINRKSIYYPYDKFLGKVIGTMEIDKTLLLPPWTKPLRGSSATGNGDCEHHVFEKNLFPIKGVYGKGTRTILCSPQKHEALHRILADCLASGNFIRYEVAIKVECPSISDDISNMYHARIANIGYGFFTNTIRWISCMRSFYKRE